MVCLEGVSSLARLLSLGAFSSWLAGVRRWRIRRLVGELKGIELDSEQNGKLKRDGQEIDQTSEEKKMRKSTRTNKHRIQYKIGVTMRQELEGVG